MISEILKRQSEKKLQEEFEKKPAPKRKRGRPKKVIDPDAEETQTGPPEEAEEAQRSKRKKAKKGV